MGSISSDSNISGILGAFHDRKLLERFENSVAFYQLGEKRPLATNDGKTVTFHYFSNMGLGASVTEATQPANSFMTTATRTATIIQLGQVTEFSDLLYKTSIVNIRDQAADQFGDSSARTVDYYIQDRLFSDETTFSSSGEEGPMGTYKETYSMSSWYDGIHGGLSAFFLSAASTGAMTKLSAISNAALSTAYAANQVPTNIANDANSLQMDLRKLRYIVSELETDNVPTFDGSTYVCVASPKVVAQIREDSEWREWNRYNDASKMFNGEVGMVENCRIIKSTNTFQFTYQVTALKEIHLATILGKQAFAVTELAGDGGIKMYDVPFTAPSLDNVLRQRAALGWIYTGCAKVLQPKAGYGLLIPVNA